MQNNYFILRHGETPYQLQNEIILYPWPEPEPILLTKRGKEQIKKIAEKLKKEKIDLIFSSDIPRTRQTAEIVSQELGGVEIIFDKRLREKDAGIFKGRPKKEYNEFFSKKEKKEKFTKSPPGGESWNEVKKRMLQFINEVDRKYKGKNILIVSHGCPLWLLQGGVKGLDEDELLKQRAVLQLKVGELRKLI